MWTSDISKLEGETSGAHASAAEDTALLMLGVKGARAPAPRLQASASPSSLAAAAPPCAASSGVGSASAATVAAGGQPDGDGSVHGGAGVGWQLQSSPQQQQHVLQRVLSAAQLQLLAPPRPASRGLPHTLLPQPALAGPAAQPNSGKSFGSIPQQHQHQHQHQQRQEGGARPLTPLLEQHIVPDPSSGPAYSQPQQQHSQRQQFSQAPMVLVDRSASVPQCNSHSPVPGAFWDICPTAHCPYLTTR